ncbi:MAG: hypothetical protein V4501_07450 [Pseudomonadota bacterium]
MISASISCLPLVTSLGNSAHYFQDPSKNSTYGTELFDPYNANFSNLILNFANNCNAIIIDANFTYSIDTKTCEIIDGYEGGGPLILFGANICRNTIDLAQPFFEECLSRVMTVFFSPGGEAEIAIQSSDTTADYTKMLVFFLLACCLCLLSCHHLNNSLRQSLREERIPLLSDERRESKDEEKKTTDSSASYQSESSSTSPLVPGRR